MSTVYDLLKDYINWSIPITLGIAIFLLSKEKLIQAYQDDLVRGGLSSCLLVTTAIWYFLYVRAVRYELDLLNSAFESEKVKRLRGFVLPTVIGLSVLFGSLIACSTNIMVYSGLVPLLAAFDLYGQATTNRNIGVLILKKHFRGDIGEKEGEILFSYYFDRPLLLRISLILITFCGAFVLAVVSHHLRRPTYGYVSYLLIIIAIIAGELVIHRWRKERDKKLLAIED